MQVAQSDYFQRSTAVDVQVDFVVAGGFSVCRSSFVTSHTHLFVPQLDSESTLIFEAAPDELTVPRQQHSGSAAALDRRLTI